MRQFETGATRDADADKPDYEGFICPLVVERYGQYMHKHRRLPDGSMRPSDNWQRGIPLDAYASSLWRHTQDFHKAHRGYAAPDIEDSLCALIFNASGYLHELLKCRREAEAVVNVAPRIVSESEAAAIRRDLLRQRSEADDDAPDQNPIAPATAQSGIPVSQLDEE